MPFILQFYLFVFSIQNALKLNNLVI